MVALGGKRLHDTVVKLLTQRPFRERQLLESGLLNVLLDGKQANQLIHHGSFGVSDVIHHD